jgi:hypothetical protein
MELFVEISESNINLAGNLDAGEIVIHSKSRDEVFRELQVLKLKNSYSSLKDMIQKPWIAG